MTVYNLAASSAIPLEKLWVDLRDGWDRLDDQERYHVHVTLRVRGDLSEQDLERLRRYAGRCPIYHMLSQVAVIEKEIERV